MIKNLPAKQEMWVRSLDGEDPMSILAWRIPGTEEPDRLQFMGWQRAGHDLETKRQIDILNCIGIK